MSETNFIFRYSCGVRIVLFAWCDALNFSRVVYSVSGDDEISFGLAISF